MDKAVKVHVIVQTTRCATPSLELVDVDPAGQGSIASSHALRTSLVWTVIRHVHAIMGHVPRSTVSVSATQDTNYLFVTNVVTRIPTVKIVKYHVIVMASIVTQ